MNYLNHIFFTIILSLVFKIVVMAQSITKQGSKYLHSNDVYTFEELGPILEYNPEAYKNYTKALRKRKTAKINGIISLSALGTGLIAYGIDPDAEGGCDSFICTSTGQDILGFGVIASVTFGAIAIVKKIGEKNKRKKAIRLYNEGVPIGYHNTAPLKELHLGQTQNGIGMVLNF